MLTLDVSSVMGQWSHLGLNEPKAAPATGHGFCLGTLSEYL